jgi:hypothetical protein
MKKTKSETQFSIPIGIENHDPNLDLMKNIVAELRRDYLAHEPGTEAQATSYKLYKIYYDRHQAGEIYIPKF